MSTTVSERALVLLGLALAGCGAEVGFDGPTDVGFFADGTPIVSDGYVNSRIAVLTRGGGVARTLDAPGVADRDNARVQVFTRELSHVASWSGSMIGRPFAVTVVGERVFVVDGGDQDPDNPAARVVVLDRAGAVLGQFSGYGTTQGQLSEPHDLVVDARGRVYVAELGTRRVQRFIPRP